MTDPDALDDLGALHARVRPRRRGAAERVRAHRASTRPAAGRRPGAPVGRGGAGTGHRHPRSTQPGTRRFASTNPRSCSPIPGSRRMPVRRALRSASSKPARPRRAPANSRTHLRGTRDSPVRTVRGVDRRTAIDSLAPVHAHALSLLDDGLERPEVARLLGLDVDELSALVRVAEAKVERIMKQEHP